MDKKLLPSLINLGLTPQEAKIYTVLLKKGPLPAKEIARLLNIFPHAVYRTCKNLIANKLIGIIKTSPITYQATPPQQAIPIFIKERVESLEENAKKITSISTLEQAKDSPTSFDIIFGKNETYSEGAALADYAKEEILIISIGEYIPQNLLLSMKKARDRGLSIRLIAHKYNEENQEILENFKKNGYEVRHFPNSGFHLAIYDRRKALLIVNNPKNTNERVAVKITSSGLSQALSDYFYSVWEKAIKI